MKKLLCILLCLTLVFGLCACGKETSPKKDNSETTAPEEKEEGNEFLNKDGTIVRPEFAGENVQLESAVPFEGDFLKAEVASVQADAGSVTFAVKMENLSDKNIFLTLGYVYINGLNIEKRYFKGIQQTYNMTANQTLELSFVCPANILAESGISQIYTGEVRFVASQYDGRVDLDKCEGLVSFKTTQTGEQRNYTEGQTIYDKDGLKVVLQNTGWLSSSSFGYVRIYVENNSEMSYNVFIPEVNIQPYGKYKENWSRGTTVSPDHSGYYTEWVEIFDIRESLPIETMALTFKISESDRLYSNHSWGSSETFTVELTDWDWSAIAYN